MLKEKRNLSVQFREAKMYLINGNFKNIDLKLRELKEEKVYYFRVNKQYRALGFIENNIFKVKSIDNHQC